LEEFNWFLLRVVDYHTQGEFEKANRDCDAAETLGNYYVYHLTVQPALQLHGLQQVAGKEVDA